METLNWSFIYGLFSFISGFTISISRKKWPTGRIIYLILSMISVLFLLLVLTNTAHHVMWQAVSIDYGGWAPALVYNRNYGFWLFIVFSYGLILCGFMVVLHSLLKARNIFRKQLIIVLIGVCFPWILSGLYVFEFNVLKHLDLTPAALSLSGLMFLWGLMEYQNLSIIPLAQKTINENLADPVIALDMDFRILDINKAGLTLFRINHFTPAHYRLEKEFPQLHEIVIKNKALNLNEIESPIDIEGEKKYWNLRLSPLKKYKKKQIGWLIILRDITRIKQTEQELRNSKNFIRNIINSMPSILIGVDITGTITQWNAEAEKRIGVNALEAEGRSLDALFPQILPYLNLEDIFENKVVRKISKVILNMAGTKLLTDIIVYPIVSENEQGAVIRVDDINERVKIEEMMVQSENMLSFSRKSDLEKSENDAVDIMDTSIDLVSNDYRMKKQFDFKTIEITKDYPERPIQFPCSKNELQQVFLNILKNGAEAMVDSRINNPELAIRIYKTEAQVVFEIKDNGPGIDKEVQKRIFEPFFTTKDVGVGTGLGLSVAYFIITENHNGLLLVESLKNEGSTFIVSLPIKENPDL